MAQRPLVVLLGFATVFASTLCLLWLLPLSPIAALQRGLYWDYASHLLFIAIAMFSMVALRRAPVEYGLSTRAWRRELKVGGVCFAVLAFAPPAVHALAGPVSLAHNSVGFVLSTVIFQLVFAGFGEELFFRGFMQGELDRAMGKPYRLLNVEFGWGLVATALLFAVGHLLNPFSPFEGRYALDFGAFFLTGVAGLIFGFVRAHFGSILAAAMLHGAWDLPITMFELDTPGQWAMSASIFAVCWYLARVFAAESRERLATDE